MDASQKISPFQLTCLLLLGRVFTVIIWKPQLTEAGSGLLAALLSPVAQFVLVLAVMKLLSLLKESEGNGWLHKAIHKLIQVAGLVFFLWAAGWSAVSCGRFISRSFYDGMYPFFFIGLMLLAGCFAVFQGLEAIARTAPIVVLLTTLGLLLLGLGAAGSMHLRYLPPLTLSVKGTAQMALGSGAMNFELWALLFLQPYATKPLKKRAIAIWLGLVALLSIATTLTVMLTLGYYAEGVEYPVLAVARCAHFSMTARLDPVLMGVWILLGLTKISMFLFLAAQLWRQLFLTGAWAWRQGGMAAGLVCCMVALSGCGRGGDTIGAKTIVTMLEVEQGNRCVVRAEYRIVGSGEGEADYGIYTAQGENLQKALEALERKESVRLFMESCRVAVIQGTREDGHTADLLEEMNACGDIRPLTAIFLSDKELLTDDKDKAVSIGRSLEKLFKKNGGILEENYTLKDSIACERDPRISLILPVVKPNDRGDGVWFIEMKTSKKG
ncbi:MAG: GerAB/ArcD/ProY family transporter [Angelakisella sp.]